MMNMVFYSCTITTLTLLLVPLLQRHPSYSYITGTVKLAFLISLFPMFMFTELGLQNITTSVNIITMNFNIKISFLFDMYTTLFFPTALFITWAIMEFTHWYMADDPQQSKFSKYLLLFLLAMTTLTSSNNMFQLFIGWEGVGIMSFLLIGWWHARTNATTSALQAVIYNRIGDIGLILTMVWTATNFNTWEMQQMFSHSTTPALPLLGLILAATGKSAQFGLHPWLPAAMEGPTPVSALLHSSTMVVAGIFLLIRFAPMLQTNQHALSTCLCLGATTTTFAALCAITQNDIKKIIAFSTSSQLGLMMLTIGLNQPELAFLHITTHAFFKALLFLCSGSIIHNLNNEQDIRKMGGMQKALPTTTACTTLGTLALAGMPFLSGFYSKDTIIETMSLSPLNAWALLISLTATALTAAYSLRLVFYVQLSTPRHPPMLQPNENSSNQTRPIIRLALGSILTGLTVTSTIIPNKPQLLTMPLAVKLAAIAVTITGLLLAMDLANQTTLLTAPKQTNPHTTLTQLMLFNSLFHRQAPKQTKNLALSSLQVNDMTWYELIGPTSVKTTNTQISAKMTTYHMGSMKTYLTTFVILLTTCLLWTAYGAR